MPTAKRVILTFSGRDKLVWREASGALAGLGHSVHVVPPDTMTAAGIRRVFSLPPERSNLERHPDLFFSVNFHGLDKHGETFTAFRDKGVPVAVWLVDNPWNLLSGLRSEFWKDTFLFVTDPSFIPGLKAHGARHAAFLPLATDPAVFARHGGGRMPPQNGQTGTDAVRSVVFAGRSAFPGKERFFLGQSVPEALRKEAAAVMNKGGRPDFFWWLNTLYPTEEAAGGNGPVPLWPGGAARRASFGAEETSLAWRAACLRHAAGAGLTVYGDSGWADHFRDMPDRVELRPPVDYYTSLAPIYASAPFSLAVTSFLLPHGLNQRHFDVWAAGGFCIMDRCPGLDIFPPDLVEPVAFMQPEEIPDIVARYAANPAEKETLSAAWRATILGGHTYPVRMRAMTESVFS